MMTENEEKLECFRKKTGKIRKKYFEKILNVYFDLNKEILEQVECDKNDDDNSFCEHKMAANIINELITNIYAAQIEDHIKRFVHEDLENINGFLSGISSEIELRFQILICNIFPNEVH